jgi:hypothetical protein
MKRRTLLAGIGSLASGSGAIATSAAIANTVQPTSQLNIVVDEQLRVRAGQAFSDDGSVKQEYADQYVPYDTNQSFFDEQDDVLDNISTGDLPVATVNGRDKNINGDVTVQAAINVDRDADTFTFEDILEIENYGGSSKSVGVSYDRDDTTYDPNGQYGEDVNVGDSASEDKLTAHDVRAVYNIQVPDRFTQTDGPIKISPAAADEDDTPANYYSIDPTQTLQIDLQIDLSPYGNFVTFDPREGIQSAVDKSPTFSGTIETVDLLDAISVQIDDS